ncbi:MAG: penicillin-binding protein 1A [Alteromonadaceae bacterium]|jgi:penicillin-binding protein 1A
MLLRDILVILDDFKIYRVFFVFSLKRLLKVGFSMMFIALIALAGLYIAMRSELPSVVVLKDIQWQTPMKIYSTEGKLISQFGEKKRIPLALDEMPKSLINAILATEDNRFYQHFGIDPIGIARAVFAKLIGKSKGGASTITQQVARNFFLSSEVTYTRKIKEVFLSFHIESLLTKDEILSLYMNKIPLGYRSFGFGAAAQVYYGKNVKELTLAQVAVLAGLPKAPSTLNPIRSPKRAKARRSVVLQRMFVTGYITSQEFEEANNAPITGKQHGAEIELSAPYIAEMAHQEMISRYGKEQAYTGGYNVYTTVSADLQLAAQKAVYANLIAYDQRHGYRGPVKQLRPELTFDPQTVIIKDIDPSTALTQEEITQALAQTTTYQHLQVAVVTHVTEHTVSIQLQNNIEASIPWTGLSWAREFIHDKKQGAAPKIAHEIVTYGDVILVTYANNEYRLSQLPQVSSSLVSLSSDNGAIKAAVGGFSFQQSQFNRVTQAKRQVGSNIKPFVYSAALDNGYTLASLVNDAPIDQLDKTTGVIWRPKNSPPVYSGPIRVRLALAQSKNVIAVRLFREVGLSKIIDHLAKFGFAPNELPKNESLALGSASLTPLEVATGYATFANGGFLITPFLIERVEDSFGKTIFTENPKIACDDCNEIIQQNISPLTVQTSLELTDNVVYDTIKVNKAERVISPQNAFLITQAMNSVIWGADWRFKPYWQGTGYRARTLERRDIAGKTGTTNDVKDAWFSGFSRRLVTTTWIGFDNPGRELGRTTSNTNLGKDQTKGGEAGAKTAQPAWIDFMKEALKGYPVEPFKQPYGLLSVRIDKKTGKLTNKTDKTSQFEYFTVDTAPTEYVTQDNSGDILDGEETIVEDIF